MLVLGRENGETVDLMLEGKVLATIMLVEGRPGSAAIGIAARPFIKILRSELVKRPQPAPSTPVRAFQPVPEDQENVPACV